jgi:hypothetical protein
MKVDNAKLKENGVSVDKLLRHYIFMTEYLWSVLEPSETQKSITVFDVGKVHQHDSPRDCMPKTL